MAREVSFTIYGRPQQRGSKTPWNPRRKDGSLALRPDGRPIIATMDSNKKSKDWMQQVRAAAAEAFQGDLLSGPVILSCVFWFDRPLSHLRTGRNAGHLKESAPAHHTQTPDLSKLVRCLEDGLTGVVWRDDKQVIGYGQETYKRWTTEAARCDVKIVELEAT